MSENNFHPSKKHWRWKRKKTRAWNVPHSLNSTNNPQQQNTYTPPHENNFTDTRTTTFKVKQHSRVSSGLSSGSSSQSSAPVRQFKARPPFHWKQTTSAYNFSASSAGAGPPKGRLVPSRPFGHSKRDSADSKRDSADSKRDTADSKRDTADSKMNSADSKMNSADSKRDSADSKRNSADSKRDSADSKRDSADSKRDSADSKRDSADFKSDSADSKRNSADSKRNSADSKRNSADSKRNSADSKRNSADSKRESADSKRDFSSAGAGPSTQSSGQRTFNSSSAAGPTKCLAIDCEMVGAGPKGHISQLARCSIVSYNGDVVFDQFICPPLPVTDYRTRWSGIRKSDLQGAIPYSLARREILKLLAGKVLVGHAIHNDLKVLNYNHPKVLIRDTSRIPLLNTKAGFPKNQPASLKRLTKAIFNRDIQMGRKGHSSVEDAKATMDLYKVAEVEWQRNLPPWLRNSEENMNEPL